MYNSQKAGLQTSRKIQNINIEKVQKVQYYNIFLSSTEDKVTGGTAVSNDPEHFPDPQHVMSSCFAAGGCNALNQVPFQFSRPRAGPGVVRIDPLRFLAGCRTRRLNQAPSVLPLSVDFLSASVFCLLVVLVRLSVPVPFLVWRVSNQV